MDTRLWPHGPRWKDLPPDALPELPKVLGKAVSTWDLLFTDYDPDFWGPPHIFRWGRDFFPPGEEEDNHEILGPRVSYLQVHGTSIYGALSSVFMNFVAKSEDVPGDPAPNDTKNPNACNPGRLKQFFETNAGRGTYSTPNWAKAAAYSTPHGQDELKSLLRFILLVADPWERTRHWRLHGSDQGEPKPEQG